MTLEACIATLKSDDRRISIGRHTYGNPTLKVWADEDRIEIGAFCSIADEVTILGGGEHNIDWVTTYPLRIAFGLELAGNDGHPTTKGPTRIGNDVWIGHGATILSGVQVGDGAVIGAGAVVGSDVPAYSVVIGNPARVIRLRFSQHVIDELKSIAWWDWDDTQILESIDELCGGDADAFAQKYRSRLRK